MNVLILEDTLAKYNDIEETLKADISDCNIKHCEYFSQFVMEASKKKYDLVVADLLVPLQKNSSDVQDVTEEIMNTIRDTESPNFATPVIAITGYSAIAEENYEKFNRLDINIVHYDPDSKYWAEAFILKAKNSIPPKTYEFVIFCALEKEAKAFNTLNYNIGPLHSTQGINCREIDIDDKKGIIIVPPRMGLINAAITCSRAIDIFTPNLICMSGICAGIEGKVNIYDVVISSMCHQHDSGKWTSEGFIPELYTVPLLHQTQVDINLLIQKHSFKNDIKNDIKLTKEECPTDSSELNFDILLATTSSGSSVIADNVALEGVKDQHRKLTSFEMESYALYEAARQSSIKNINYFSAKSVVDNGDKLKGDEYHRVACILSAKTVCELIAQGI
tara:strand:- start:2124 stop:3296 length:1173 start_codon:yes stop_codon:yes gene_type:complete